MSDAIHRMLLERLEIQLQLTATMMADLEVISEQLLALHPDAATKSEELRDQYATLRDQSLVRVQEMIRQLRQSVEQAVENELSPSQAD